MFINYLAIWNAVEMTSQPMVKHCKCNEWYTLHNTSHYFVCEKLHQIPWTMMLNWWYCSCPMLKSLLTSCTGMDWYLLLTCQFKKWPCQLKTMAFQCYNHWQWWYIKCMTIATCNFTSLTVSITNNLWLLVPPDFQWQYPLLNKNTLLCMFTYIWLPMATMLMRCFATGCCQM